MAQMSITAMTCDRCGDQAELRRPEDGYEWAGLNYSETNSPRWIGSSRSSKPQWADLCPDCSRELYDWFRAGQAS
jgi:hypothetical protein